MSRFEDAMWDYVSEWDADEEGRRFRKDIDNGCEIARAWKRGAKWALLEAQSRVSKSHPEYASLFNEMIQEAK